MWEAVGGDILEKKKKRVLCWPVRQALAPAATILFRQRPEFSASVRCPSYARRDEAKVPT